jgi:predicted MPP superfamily phosphohydrolase
VGLPDAARYGVIGLAAVASAIAVANAVRVPPIRDVEVEIAGLSPQFEGYRILQLTDLHISKLFPAAWASAVVARANAAGSDVIVVTGDFHRWLGRHATQGCGAASSASSSRRRLGHTGQPRTFLRL